MKGKNKKLVLSIIIVLVLSIIMATVVFAGDFYNKTLQAAFRNVKIYRNGTQVQLNLPADTLEPFIVNNRTYVPLSAVSEIFDKEVSWDQNNYIVHINDKEGQTTSPQVLQLMTQLAERDAKIKELEEKVKNLEAQLKNIKPSLSDFEKELNKKFNKIGSVKVDIELSGNEKDIKVEIYADLDKYWDEWDDLTDKNKKYYIEDLVDYIKETYEDAKISGFIEDESLDEKLVTFKIDSKGKLDIDFDDYDYDDEDLEDLEKYLNKKYNKIDDVYVTIELDWDGDDIEVTLWIDYDEFNDLKKADIKSYLYDLYDQIEDEFGDVAVYGYFVSDDKYEDDLLYFEFDSDGYLIKYKEFDV